MRDHTPSFMRRATCAGLVAYALVAAASTQADDLFGPDPAKPAPSPLLQCPAGAPAGPDLQSRIAEIQRQITARAAGDLPADGRAVMLNGSGYNYGGGSHDLDQAAINFEAKQAR
ncbi:MAG TPA: hypothetical protein VKM54_04980 [Myxococcota bacterium]|nr:hypothetical protein [Myxococcota bacterium]